VNPTIPRLIVQVVVICFLSPSDLVAFGNRIVAATEQQYCKLSKSADPF
jgi:hypothetical protein